MAEEIKLISFDPSTLSEEAIRILLLDSDVEPSLFDEIARTNVHRPEILHYILKHPRTPPATREFVAQSLNVPVVQVAEEAAEVEEQLKREWRAEGMPQRIQQMKVGERIQLALKGGKGIRSLLMRDSNKEIMLKVLENPKITDSEIEIIAKQRTSPEEAIRTIAKKREWMRKYSIVFALITNPKTPPGIAISHISTLRLKDIINIEKNRNIPMAVRAAAKRLIAIKKVV